MSRQVALPFDGASPGLTAEAQVDVTSQDHTDTGALMSCSDNLDFMRELPDESMKLIVTSPPYNIGKSL